MRTVTLRRTAAGLAACLWLAAAARAGGARVRASVDASTVALGDAVNYTITIEGESRLRPFRLPAMKDFDILSGPATGYSQRIVNGQVSQSTSYTFQLRPKHEGACRIPPFSLRIAGKTYTTPALVVKVVKTAKRKTLSIDEAAFIEWAPSERTVYVYQQFQLALRLYVYRRCQARGLQLGDFSAGARFLEENISHLRPRVKTEERNGFIYNVQEFPLRALFPVAPGKQKIPAVRVTGQLLIPRRHRRRRSLFDDPFFDDDFFGGFMGGDYDVRPLSLTAPAVTITVKPLPPQGRPADFNDVVGSYDLQVSIAPRKVKVGDGVTLTMVVSGQGYLKAVEEPRLEHADGFKTYRSEVTTDVSIVDGRLGGRKVFKKIIEPQNEHITQTPVVVFSFFDPAKGRYVTLRRGPFPLRVEPRPVEQPLPTAQLPAANEKQDVYIQTEDILPIMTSYSTFANRAEPLYARPWVWAAFAGPPVLLLACLLVQRRRERLLTDTGYARRRGARAAARRELAEARRAAKRGEPAVEVSARLAHALRGFIADKLDAPAASVSPLSVGDLLAGAGVPDDVVQRARRALDACDRVRFSAGADDAASLAELHREIEQLISALDKKL